MSDLALPEPKLVDPPRTEPGLVWTALVSLLLHAGLLLVVFWSPQPAPMEAEPPQAIDVELVTPPDLEATEPPPAETTPAETPGETAAAPQAAASQAEAEPSEPVATPPAAPAPEPPASPAAEASPSAPPPAAAAPSAPVPIAPIPLPRRQAETPAPTPSQGAAASPTGEPVAALQAESADAEGARPDALSADPGLAALELGELRTAERFYLETMLQQPGLARARDMLQTLPRDKRLSQTCNIEALAQIGNSGAGFAPDVVMTDAYARSELSDTGLSATGAVFRSQDKWYGFAFDCTLSQDLTQVTAFSYRLGADVTEAVLARLEQR